MHYTTWQEGHIWLHLHKHGSRLCLTTGKEFDLQWFDPSAGTCCHLGHMRSRLVAVQLHTVHVAKTRKELFSQHTPEQQTRNRASKEAALHDCNISA